MSARTAKSVADPANIAILRAHARPGVRPGVRPLGIRYFHERREAARPPAATGGNRPGLRFCRKPGVPGQKRSDFGAFGAAKGGGTLDLVGCRLTVPSDSLLR